MRKPDPDDRVPLELDAGLSEAETRAALLIRRVFSLGLAGIIAGAIVGGLGSRLVMRISAIAAGPARQGMLTEGGNRVGEISFGGTVELVIFGGVLSGAAGAIVLVATERWLPHRRGLEGLIAGLFLLATAGATVIKADNFDFLILDPAWLNVSMFAVLFVLFGLVTMPLANEVGRRFDQRAGETSAYGPLPLILLASFLTIPVYGSFFVEGFCQCDDPPVVAGTFFVVASVATVIAWVNVVRTGDRPRLWLKIMGWAGVTGALIFGAVRLIGEIRTIV